MNEGPLSALPWFPIDPAWVEQSAAFVHEDPRMAGAYLRLLLAAWRGVPAASVPASHRYIAQTTGLDLATVGAHFSVLTEGFTLLSDGRLHHGAMERLVLRILDRFGKDIEEFSLAAAMALQDPNRFSLVVTETARGGVRGKRSLPRGFGFEMHPDLREWCAANGYPTAGDQDWVMSRFVDYSVARGDQVKEWPAQFRLWAAKEIRFGRRPPSLNPGAQAALDLARPTPSGVFAGMVASRGEQARATNAAAFGLASARRPPTTEFVERAPRECAPRERERSGEV